MTVPANFALVWSDEFNLPFLDTSRWWTRQSDNNGMGQSELANGNVQLWEEGQDGRACHVMTGASLKLMVNPPLAPATNYTSGMIRSKRVIPFVRPTYIEFRAKFSDVSGMHPGGWVAGEPRDDGSLSWPPEIDIAEFLNDGTIPPNIHMGLQTNGVPWDGTSPPFAASYTNNTSFNPEWGTPVPNNTFDAMSFFRPPFNANAAFHTYSLLYVPGAPSTFTIAVDGKMALQGTYDWMGADGRPIFANLLFTTEVGGNGVGAIDDSKLPTAAIELEYVRVYEKISVVGQDLYRQVGV